MTTTLDIPDDLLRAVEARAALDGMELRDFVAEGLRRMLEPTFPIVRSAPGTPTLELTDDRIKELEIEADSARHEESLRR
jgi:hypothetical protein